MADELIADDVTTGEVTASAGNGDLVRVGVIVNQGKELGGGTEELRAVLAELGHADPPWIEVPKSKKAPKAVRRLVLKKGVDRLLVWGGDGTVRRCIDTVLTEGYDVDVAVLPAGTANTLAQNLGIPTDLRGAVEIAVCGQARPIDIGRMNGAHFAVMAGTGFDALLIREADDSGLKDRFGQLGYVWAGVRHRSVDPFHAEITVDGRPWFSGETSTVLVANVGSIMGGLRTSGDADVADGAFEIGVVSARSATEWIRLLARAGLKAAAASPFTEMTTARRVKVKLDRSMPWQVDGGDRERDKRFTIRCLPGAVRILQPPATLPAEPPHRVDTTTETSEVTT
jgi:diacylglycerol kinase (ATP)